MDTLTLTNLAAYSAQVVSIVLVATAVAALMRIDVPGLRYIFWRGVLALCLLLPLLQARQTPQRPAAGSVSVETGIAVSVTPSGPARSSVDWTALAVPLLAAGAAARLGWLAVSFGRLRRLRRRGAPAAACAAHDELQQIIGTRCEIRYVAGLRQPATFGLLRPVILLPATLASAPGEVQRAVLSHELFHVKRRDWGWLLAEELVCAVFWFNPAIWWAVSRVHVARELVVDELAVLATGRRRAYVEALMAFADETSLAPVAAFGGRRQLFHRIVMLSKEGVMSSRRLVITCAVVAAALAAGTWQAVGAFPLTAEPQLIRQEKPGPLEQRAKPVTPENPIPRRLNVEQAVYPAEAEAVGARGSVALRITLDELGRVVEARRISLEVITTSPSAAIRMAEPNPGEQRFLINNDQALSDGLRAAAAAFEAEAMRAVEQWRYDPPAAAPISFVVSFSFSPGGTSAAQGTVTPRGRGGAAVSTMQADGAIRVGGNIKPPKKIRDVRPVYPEVAKAASVKGMVIVEARVSADGSVEEARVLRSIPLLDQAAIDAVMQWRFTPTLMNGVPVPVIMTVTVNFTPDDGAPAVEAPVVQATEVTPSRPLPRVVKEVKPKYPDDARAAKVEGTVEVEVTIGTEGTVTGARVIRSVPMLDDAALAAVRQWEFSKVAQPVAVNIELSFALSRMDR
jgi:protein TonB